MNLLTPWGESLDAEAVLQEYPRPQLVRESYLNLNGTWHYAITPTAAGAGPPADWDGSILVPFSPEAPLSGVGRQLQPDETLWYHREITLPDGFRLDTVLLHFGAVDQECTVHLNGHPVGEHVGGYLPFTLDVTRALLPGRNELVVAVRDQSDTGSRSRGKQKLKRGGIWYTAQSGIWQTVWLESVPYGHIERLTITPRLEDGCVEVTVHSAGTGEDVTLEVLADGVVVASARARVDEAVRIPLGTVREWSPESPFLYDLHIALGTDRVTSYFGMRSFGVGPDADGYPRLLLNGRPYFHAGVLDQGYWPDGLYTAPSDAALAHDIAEMKRLGFTMLRKHIKIEPLRWYHHCDRLGMLVCQDAVNGGTDYTPWVVTAPAIIRSRLDDRRHRAFAREDAAGRQEFRSELRAMVELLRNVTSIAVWVPFNEGWGQFDALDITRELRELDSTRAVDHASGWHDQGGGDLHSLHVYLRAFRVPRKQDRRVLALTEYGGYSIRTPGHDFNDREFGYRRHRSTEELERAFVKLHEKQIIPAIPRGLAATVYTQLSDVEDELNGLITYDRRVQKLSDAAVRSVTQRLRYPDADRAREGGTTA